MKRIIRKMLSTAIWVCIGVIIGMKIASNNDECDVEYVDPDIDFDIDVDISE